jgi:hypothetical protein
VEARSTSRGEFAPVGTGEFDWYEDVLVELSVGFANLSIGQAWRPTARTGSNSRRQKG